MPDFARVAAYIVIDTMTLLLWHKIMMSRVSRVTCYAHLKSLIDFYLRQCQPSPLRVSRPQWFQRRIISVGFGGSHDTIA
jgi:hypothetical protein